MVRVVSSESKKMWQEHQQGSRDRGTGMRLTERIRKLIPEPW